jgi:hypothetical protein
MCVQCSHEHVRAFTVDNIFVDTISMEKSWLHLDQTGGHSISWGQVTAGKSSESRCRGIERLFARLLTLAVMMIMARVTRNPRASHSVL